MGFQTCSEGGLARGEAAWRLQGLDRGSQQAAGWAARRGRAHRAETYQGAILARILGNSVIQARNSANRLVGKAGVHSMR